MIRLYNDLFAIVEHLFTTVLLIYTCVCVCVCHGDPKCELTQQNYTKLLKVCQPIGISDLFL